jgi:hypothetical protein
MGDILVTATGRIFRRVDECTALLLMEAFPESFKRADPRQQPAAPVQTVPIFYVAPSPTTGNIGLHAKLPTGEIRSAYAASTKASAESSLGAGEIPQHIWDAYAAKSDNDKNREALGEMAARQVCRNKW